MGESSAVIVCKQREMISSEHKTKLWYDEKNQL